MLADLLRELRGDPQFMATVAAWRTLPAQAAQVAAPPAGLHPALTAALQVRGIDALYTHQAQAVAAALAGEHVAVVTPTASGKTLCYNLPVFHTLLTDPSARALYLFPTKALAQDQLAELTRLTTALSPSHPLTYATYDGDTPSAERSRIRKTARILLSNPDMLHVGILPYHTQWAPFLAGLRWIIIDEMHTYRGVFGSQVANVLRRLQRLCRYYGGQPQFICTSATIANPAALAEHLIEQPVTLVAGNGAPRGEKQIILVNPPLLDAEKGIRRSATLEATDLAARCLRANLQTIVFGRARLTTELLLTYVREKAEPHPSLLAPRSALSAIRGYRGGYLPSERRAIEAGLRSGDVRGVVATNALELGIDIGALQAAVICGYPGSIASTWQQMGRAGRTTEASLGLLVATGGALDQYVIQHPEFIFEQSPEHALINPDNLMLLLDQVRCATFELPFATGERFGANRVPSDETDDTTGDVLALLVEEGDVQPHNGEFFWSGESYPARRVSLRSAGRDSVVIQAETTVQQSPAAPRRPAGRDLPAAYTVIGAVDHASAPLLVHDGAIYLHEGQSYQVKKLDLTALRADVAPVIVDYYTEAATETTVTVLAVHGQRETPASVATFGDVEVTAQVIAYRRIKRHTHETLGVQPLDYPPQILDTSAYWLAVQSAVQNALERAGLWYDSVNDYGPNWQEQRAKVRARDHYRCVQCRAPEPPGQEHDVHHRIPFRTFGCVSGVNEHYLLANRLENLMLLCRACHRRLETAGRLRTGMDGLAYALTNLAPVHLMCDRADLGVHVSRADTPSSSHPLPLSPSPLATIYLYERAPAGLGFSTLLYELHDDLLRAARALVGACTCQNGCPGCVGPILEEQSGQLATKRLTAGLLDALLA